MDTILGIKSILSIPPIHIYQPINTCKVNIAFYTVLLNNPGTTLSSEPPFSSYYIQVLKKVLEVHKLINSGWH